MLDNSLTNPLSRMFPDELLYGRQAYQQTGALYEGFLMIEMATQEEFARFESLFLGTLGVGNADWLKEQRSAGPW